MNDRNPNDLLMKVNNVDYLGGHPNAINAADRVSVLFLHGGVSVVDRRHGEGITLSWDNVSSLRIDQRDQVRASLARVLLLGPLALAFPGGGKVGCYLVIEDASGLYIFALKSDQQRAQSHLSPVVKHFERWCRLAGESPSPLIPPASVPDAPAGSRRTARERLAELAGLRDDGLLTPEEYETARRAILDAI